MFLKFARLGAHPGRGRSPGRDSTEESCRASGIETSPKESLEGMEGSLRISRMLGPRLKQPAQRW